MRLLKMLLPLLLLTVVIPLSLAQTSEPDVVTYISSLDFSPDGNTLAMGMAAGYSCEDVETFSIVLINLNSNTEDKLYGHYCPVVSLEFNFDGMLLVSSDLGGELRTWDIPNKNNLREIFTGATPSVLWSPVENHFLEFNEYSIYIEDQNRNPLSIDAWQKSPNGEIKAATWNPEGSKIAFGDMAGSILIWNTPTNVIELTTNHHISAITALDWNPIHNAIASADEGGVIHIWDAATGDLLTSVSTGKTIHDLVWSPDGNLLASAGEDSFVRIWMLQDSTDAQSTLTELTSFDYHAPVYTVAWSPDGVTLAYGGRGVDGQNGQVEIVDVSALVCTHTPKSSLCPLSSEISQPKP